MKIKHFMFIALIGLFTADLSAQTPQQLRDTINFRFRIRPMDKSFGTADLRAAVLPIVNVIEANKINGEATYAKKTALSDTTLTLKSLINQKAVQAVSTAVATSRDYTDSFFPLAPDATKLNIADTSVFKRKADENKEVWKLQGNDFFDNNSYKIGVKSGVDFLASISPNYYSPKNVLHIGLNVDNADDYSQNVEKALISLRPDDISTIVQSPKAFLSSRISANGSGFVSFSVKKENETHYRYFQTNFNDGLAQFSLSTKKGAQNATYKTTIFTTDSVGIYANLSTDINGANNGDLLLNQNTARAYIFKDSKVQKIAFTSEVILKAASIPVSTSDSTGNVGDEISDNNWKYIKTSVGWKRFALSTF